MKFFLNFLIIFGEIIPLQTSSKIHAAVQCPSDIVASVIQGQCWNRHDIHRENKRGQQLRSPGHLSKWTASLDGAQSYDGENMIIKLQFP